MRRLVLLSVGILLSAEPAYALLTTPGVVSEKLAAATLVADIVVDDVSTVPDATFGLLSRATARLERVTRWNGDERSEPRSGDPIVIVTPGGERQELGLAITGIPRPRRTRRYHAHLKARASGEYEVTGFDAGLVPTDGERTWSRNRTDGSNGDGTGPFLFWPQASFPLPYFISVGTFVGRADYVAAIDRAFRTWRDAPETRFELLPLGCTAVIRNDNDGINAVILVKTDWPYDPAAIAITRNFYVAGTTGRAGVILDSDILINGELWDFSTKGDPLSHDVQNILTHEAGHFLGLGHEHAPPGPSGDSDAVMYATAVPGETVKRTLHANDLAAIQAAYPGGGAKLPDFPIGTSCLVPETAPSCNAIHGGGGGPRAWLVFLAWLAGTLAVGRRLGGRRMP